MQSKISLEDAIKKYLDGSASQKEQALVEQWFESAGDDRAFLHATDVDKDASFQSLLGRIKQDDKTEDAESESYQYSSVWSRWRVAASILIVLGIAASGWFYLGNKNKKSTQVDLQSFAISTSVGELKELVLPDSSHVWLNANSKLVYKSNFLDSRQLELEGEALFEVTHDTSHPFSVRTADGMQVKVLGTRFDLRSYAADNETKLSVVRGCVSFANQNHVLDTLLKGDVGRFNKAGGQYQKSKIEDVAKIEGWTTGQWQFDNLTVKGLSMLLKDQYGVQLIIQKESLEKAVLNVNFTREQSADEIIRVFSTIVQCKYKWDGVTKVTLY